MLKIAFHDIYNHPVPKNHRFPMEKYALIPQELLNKKIITPENIFTPHTNIQKELVLGPHQEEYINRLLDGTLSKKEERAIGFEYSKELIEREFTILNGTVQCTDYAIKHGIAMNVAGGTHHAHSNKGEGFCLLNDQAVAANYLLKNNKARKILIIDLDVHQGNGTAEIFENNSQVFTFSMHGEKNYPFKKERSDLDIALPDQSDDGYFLNILKHTLPKIIDDFKPDFLFYQSGVDTLENDKLGRISMTLEGCKTRDRFVLETAKAKKLPIVVCMGGGYSSDIEEIVEAHVNTYKLAQQIWFNS